MARRNPWSYKIDYDKAIAEDQKIIEGYERMISLGLLRDPNGEEGYSILSLLFFHPEKAQELGVDLGALFELCEIPHPLAVEASKVKGWYQRGQEAGKRIDSLLWPLDINSTLPFESEAKEAIKKAKASLARHRRNKSKGGYY